MPSVLTTKKLTKSQESLLFNAGIAWVNHSAIQIESHKNIQLPELIENAIITSKNAWLAIKEETKIENAFVVGSKTEQLLKEAKLLEAIGVFAIVLECVKASTSKLITSSLKIPTIGIGSSVYCDGQVLVTDDMLGLNNANIRFVKKFADIKKVINQGVKKFKKEILSKKYPTKKYSY